MSLGLSGGVSNQTTNSNSLTTGSSSGSTSRTLNPFQQSLQTPLFSLIKNMISNPSSIVKPALDQAKQNITSEFATVPQTLRDTFMATGGGGKSGKYGQATMRANLARQGQLANADSSAAVAASQLPGQAAGIASGLYNFNNGSTFSGSSSQQQTGTSDTSGSSFGGSLGI